MVFSVVKYAVIGYAVVKAGRFVARKVSDWRGGSETQQ
jgi:hypothetical protein